MTKTCPNCGAEVAEQAKFCPHCGFTIEEKVEETKFMPETPAPAKPTMHGQFTSTAEEGFPFSWSTGQFAGWWRRFVACVILDGLILGLILGAIGTAVFLLLWDLPFLIFGRVDKNLAGIGGLIGLIIGLAGVIVAYILYVIVPTGKTGMTIGKRIMGIKVVDKEGNPPGIGKAFLREVVGKLISKIIFGLGFILAAFDNQRRAWHDRIAGTYVIPK
ncbi:MAG: RDD family protein [Candidatus Hydrothermia bacterium]